MAFDDFAPYVSVAERRAQALRKIAQLEKKGITCHPVVIEGRQLTTTFWGKAWCKHIESYSDYATRLPRGRSYVRNGCVIDLQLDRGLITAQVNGTSLYRVQGKVKTLSPKRWTSLVAECAGKIDSVVELLSGKLSNSVMEVLCRPQSGVLPSPSEIELHCSCPDGAWLCKHLAAVLYGIGARLDEKPQLLFLLRGVDEAELVAAAGKGLVSAPVAANAMEGADLSELFGIELAADSDDAGTALPAERTAEPVARAKREPSTETKVSALPRRRTKKAAPRSSR